MRVERPSLRVIRAIHRIEGRPEEKGFWTKERICADLYITLPVGVVLTLLHSGWYNLVLFAVIAFGGLMALGLSRTSPATPPSILSKR